MSEVSTFEGDEPGGAMNEPRKVGKWNCESVFLERKSGLIESMRINRPITGGEDVSLIANESVGMFHSRREGTFEAGWSAAPTSLTISEGCFFRAEMNASTPSKDLNVSKATSVT